MRIATMPEAEAARVAAPVEDAGIGALRTERGNLPLDRLDVRADISGLVVKVELTQEFINVYDQPLEATYIFPLPDRAAVTGMKMTADDRVVEADLQERGAARQAYDQAIAAGQRASIAEEERPDVFTMRVGNILPGERVSVELSLTGPLSYEDGEATFRFPLVVAPRYIPGTALPGGSVGEGYAPDTDAVPDASRITPPVLLPGFPNPLRLSIEVDIDPAGLPLGDVRSSLHQVSTSDNHISVRAGERADRDFVLRLAYGTSDATASLTVTPDAEGDEGTFRFTVLPPAPDGLGRPRDVVLLLDRSGSMDGWKMVAARRAAARIVDTLGSGDRFAVLAFDHQIETPPSLGGGLVDATDRHRFRAVEHLARMDARGGTELLAPLRQGLRLLADTGEHQGRADVTSSDRPGQGGRDRVLVLVTDGQVGNEDQILREAAASLHGVRVHSVGIDRAVNAGFLGRLATAGGGRCELVESEDRLDEAMDRIHRRIGSPVVTGLSLTPNGLSFVDGTFAPARLPDMFPGVPYVVSGRYKGAIAGSTELAGSASAKTAPAIAGSTELAGSASAKTAPAIAGSATLRGTTRDGREWSATAVARRLDNPALRSIWARAHLRELEDAYVSQRGGDPASLEDRITAASLRFGVLCRFTAYVAVDTRVVTEGGQPHRVVQPVEPASGWDMLEKETMSVKQARVAPMAMVMPMGFAGGGRPVPPPAAAPAPAAPMAPGGPPPAAGYAPPSPAPRGRGGARSAFDEGVGAIRNRIAGRPAGRPAASPPAAEPGVDLRDLLAQEAARLHEAAQRPDYERRELLEDLGSRLAALGVAELRELVEALRPEEIARRPLDELWAHAIRVLEGYAGRSTGPESPRRSAFWKR